MRITFVLSSLWLSGGVRVVIEYANRLAARGHHLTLVTPGGTRDPHIDQELSPQVQVIETRRARPAQPGRGKIAPLAALTWELARAVPASDVILSTHTPTTPATWIAAHLFRRGVPVWLYQDYIEMFIGRPLESWLVRHALRWHRRALVVSAHSKEELSAFTAGDIVIVGEGLSHAETFRPLPVEQRLNVPGRIPVLYMGDMRPRKGMFDFLQSAELAAARFPNIHLWIVAKEECQVDANLAHELIFRPSRVELARLYASCALFVSAAWWESFGLPPLEAMACGAPVVMTDSRGGREYARPGENCLLTPPRDPQALAQAIETVLSDPELETRLRRAGPPTAARFDWAGATDRFEAALQSL